MELKRVQHDSAHILLGNYRRKTTFCCSKAFIIPNLIQKSVILSKTSFHYIHISTEVYYIYMLGNHAFRYRKISILSSHTKMWFCYIEIFFKKWFCDLWKTRTFDSINFSKKWSQEDIWLSQDPFISGNLFCKLRKRWRYVGKTTLRYIQMFR